MIAFLAQLLGLSPIMLAVRAAGIVLLVVGYLGATWSAYYKGEAACDARHAEAARQLQIELDRKSEEWRREVDAAAAAAEKLNQQTETFANASDAVDASRALCAGPRSMRYLNAIK